MTSSMDAACGRRPFLEKKLDFLRNVQQKTCNHFVYVVYLEVERSFIIFAS